MLNNIMSVSTAAHLGGGAFLAASFEAPLMAAAVMLELTNGLGENNIHLGLCLPTVLACVVSNKVNKAMKIRKKRKKKS